jgi:hypothetical protein
MAHYLIAQLNDGRYAGAQILSPAGIAGMRPAVEATSMGVSMGQYGWAFIADRGQTRIVWHDGVVPDFFAYMALVPDSTRASCSSSTSITSWGSSCTRGGDGCGRAAR